MSSTYTLGTNETSPNFHATGPLTARPSCHGCNCGRKFAIGNSYWSK